MFSVLIIGLLLSWALFSLRNENLIEYFKTHTGLGILKGVVLGVLFALLFALAGGCSSGTYFNDASVYAGLDHTKKDSPMCEPVGADSHTTSNMGLKTNVFQTHDKRLRVGSKYTHHSCAFSPDAASYDAIGVELDYKFWIR